MKGPSDAIGPRRIGDDDMRAHGVSPGGERPHLEVVDGLDSGHPGQRPLERAQVDMRRDALHQDVDGLPDKPHRARYDEQPDQPLAIGSTTRSPVVWMIPAAVMTARDASASPRTSR